MQTWDEIKDAVERNEESPEHDKGVSAQRLRVSHSSVPPLMSKPRKQDATTAEPIAPVAQTLKDLSSLVCVEPNQRETLCILLQQAGWITLLV